MGITFFDWVERDGQTAVAKALGEGFHLVRVHRATHAKHAVDEGLIARCEVVLGPEFDRAGTLDRWYQMRQAREPAEPVDAANAAAVDRANAPA